MGGGAESTREVWDRNRAGAPHALDREGAAWQGCAPRARRARAMLPDAWFFGAFAGGESESASPSFPSHVLSAQIEQESRVELERRMAAVQNVDLFVVDGAEGKVRCVKVEKDIRALLKPQAEKAITRYAEYRQPFFEFQTEPLLDLACHTFALLEVDGGDVVICTERYGDSLELMLGPAGAMKPFATAVRATGDRRHAPVLHAKRDLSPGAGLPKVTVGDLLAWIVGPVARRWRPYCVFRANARQYCEEVQGFLCGVSEESGGAWGCGPREVLGGATGSCCPSSRARWVRQAADFQTPTPRTRGRGGGAGLEGLASTPLAAHQVASVLRGASPVPKPGGDGTPRRRRAPSHQATAHDDRTPAAAAEQLNHGEYKVRRAACQALGQLGERAASQAGVLAERLLDDDWTVREAACQAFGRIGAIAAAPHADAIAARLGDDQWQVRCAACEALGQLGVAHALPHADALMEALRNERPEVHQAACDALARLGSAAAPGLAAQLRAADGDGCGVATRATACSALGQMGPAAAAQVGDVAALLADEHDRVRLAACLAMGRMCQGPGVPREAAPHAAEVAACLADADVEIRRAAGEALYQMGEEVAPHADAVAWRLVDEQWQVRRAACAVLGELGPAAAPQAEALATCLADPQPQVREAAREALGWLGDSAAPALAACCSDPDPGIRQAACEALGRLGEVASAHAPVVASLLRDGRWQVRQTACDVLQRLGEEAAAPYVSIVIGCLGDRDGDVRRSALETLMQLGGTVMPFAPYIAVHLSDERWPVRLAACKALAQLGVAAEPYAGMLAQLAKHDAEVSEAACEALRRLGMDA